MAGLPARFGIYETFPSTRKNSHLFSLSSVVILFINTAMKLTATGIASVFHRIPILKFSFIAYK